MVLKKEFFGHIRFSNAALDSTLIEINREYAMQMEQRGAYFLISASPSRGVQIFNLGYPGDYAAISLDKGIIVNLYLDNTHVYHTACTQPGSSGSPIISYRCEVVAIHAKLFSLECNAAINLEKVLDSVKDEDSCLQIGMIRVNNTESSQVGESLTKCTSKFLRNFNVPDLALNNF